ncbi:isochorismatase family protein [Streptomyces sp. M41]|uniref:isochorismatase family protein n=1 Tax=Streptomyces sp. M41 TaxID=3059412 RepID=UPI00374CF8D0
MQHYLLRTLQDRAPVGELLANIGRLTRSARSAGVPVVYVVRVPGGQVRPVPGRDTAGRGAWRPTRPPSEAAARAVADIVQPQPGDTVFTAKQPSSFAGTRLRARLRELARDQLIVVGAPARTDVLLTATDAGTQELRPFVVADAVVDETAGDHATAVRRLAAICAAVTLTDRVVGAFGAGREDAAAG